MNETENVLKRKDFIVCRYAMYFPCFITLSNPFKKSGQEEPHAKKIGEQDGASERIFTARVAQLSKSI